MKKEQTYIWLKTYEYHGKNDAVTFTLIPIEIKYKKAKK